MCVVGRCVQENDELAVLQLPFIGFSWTEPEIRFCGCFLEAVIGFTADLSPPKRGNFGKESDTPITDSAYESDATFCASSTIFRDLDL